MEQLYRPSWRNGGFFDIYEYVPPPESYYEHAEILGLIIDSKTATNARTGRVQLRPKDARERQLIFTSEKL